MPSIAPYGTWRSPITAELLVQGVGLSDVETDGQRVLWNELRPSEDGRNVLVAALPGGGTEDLLPPELAARTLAHEYGGRCCAAHDGTVVFSNRDDQRLWWLRPGKTAAPLTPPPPAPASVRFADPVISPDGRWLVCVRESHGDTVDNDIVAIALTGPAAEGGAAEPRRLTAGHDFYSAPRLSPDGRRLAWLSWDHPNMPWDSTELWEADFSADATIDNLRLVAGGEGESVVQPRWSPDGRLHHISDRSGWWNIYDDKGVALAPLDAEFSGPDWEFGQSSYAFLADGRMVASWSDSELGHLGLVVDGAVTPIDLDYSYFESLQPVAGGVVAVAGGPTIPTAIVRVGVDDGSTEVLRRSREGDLPAGYLSRPEAVDFPTEGGLSAHALFYQPVNRDFAAAPDERPPLVVMSHGGPTGDAYTALHPVVQFFTSRGLAVVDVNYGGSTGYGRDYRERLRGSWGIVDVDDCVNAALWLAGQGKVDGDRMVIRGGSAGGFTTLAVLAFRDVFAAGANYFGVADLGLLARDTHKFESRYLDRLVGPYPEAEEVYRARSALYHVDGFSRPLIVFQGLEDAVVAPEQSELIVDALKTRGIPVAYFGFEGEQHGFRKAENIVRSTEAEFAFFGRVLGFTPADEIESFPIFNEEALPAPAAG